MSTGQPGEGKKAIPVDKKLRGAICILLIAFFSITIVNLLPTLRVAENLLYDLRISYLSSPGEQSSEIVIVGITEETLATLPYRSPVDRQFINELLLDLDKKNAKVIGLDILIDQSTELEKDIALRKTLTSIQTPLVVATAAEKDGLLPAQAEYLARFLQDVEQGSAAVIKDTVDGVIRNIPFREIPGNQDSLGFIARIASTIGLELPGEDSLTIDFRQGPDSQTPLFPIYPAHTVELLPKAWFSGKIVLIGFELGFEDRHITPLTRGRLSFANITGVQIHAQALAQLLDKREIVIPGLAWDLAILMAFASLGIGLLLLRMRLGTQILLIAGAFLVIWAGAALIFSFGNIMVKILPANMSLIISSLIAIVYQWRIEQSRRQFIYRAFSRYLSVSYVDQLVANPDLLKVSGESREATFLFTDLAGFTPLTEKLGPHELVSLINEYLDKTCEIVTRHGGMVACVVGDALHVIFNAPIYQHDHAQRAVETAIELDAFCQDFAALKCSRGIQLDVTRIGINTGVTVIGNFGGNDRIEYTAMGDAINTAARLETVNKHLGTRVCVSESTVMQCSGITFRPIGCLMLKGKANSVKVFEPTEILSTQTADNDSYFHAYQKMEKLEPEALNAFSDLSGQFNDDSLVSFHLNRLKNGESGTTIVMKEK